MEVALAVVVELAEIADNLAYVSRAVVVAPMAVMVETPRLLVEGMAVNAGGNPHICRQGC